MWQPAKSESSSKRKEGECPNKRCDYNIPQVDLSISVTNTPFYLSIPDCRRTDQKKKKKTLSHQKKQRSCLREFSYFLPSSSSEDVKKKKLQPFCVLVEMLAKDTQSSRGGGLFTRKYILQTHPPFGRHSTEPTISCSFGFLSVFSVKSFPSPEPQSMRNFERYCWGINLLARYRLRCFFSGFFGWQKILADKRVEMEIKRWLMDEAEGNKLLLRLDI